MKKVILTLSVIVLSGLMLHAADAPKKEGGDKKGMTTEEKFKKADTNSDGFLSKDEFVAAFGKKDAAKAEERYKKMDKKGDGKVTLEEFTAGMAGGKKKDAAK